MNTNMTGLRTARTISWPGCIVIAAGCLAIAASDVCAGPYAPPVGQPGTTAVSMDSPLFQSWANDFRDVHYGLNVSDIWMTPDLALGKALGTIDDVVSLGDGGRITLTFPKDIINGPGSDFAVFENAFGNYFLELAWVEVSSDGTNFFRFPNHSLTGTTVPFIGGRVDATNIDGLAGKYAGGYGTPFDLDVLKGVSPMLDVRSVKYVRLLDITGDGSCLDSDGHPIYDPIPTAESGGFDLDAVGVMNQLNGGDANRDGVVDISDLGILAGNYNLHGQSWSTGDFNDDGTVDLSDLGILAGNYSKGQTQGVAGVGVPEPASLAILAVGGLAVAIRRRRSGRANAQAL